MSKSPAPREVIARLLADGQSRTAGQIASETGLQVVIVRCTLSRYKFEWFVQASPPVRLLRAGAGVLWTNVRPTEPAPTRPAEEYVVYLDTRPSEAGFHCSRRGRFVTFAACIDDYTDQAARFRGDKTHPCLKCPEGARRRRDYAEGRDVR